MIYILFPTTGEAEPFLDLMDDRIPARFADEFVGRPGYAGIVAGSRVTTLICGVGQASAAQSATSVIESGHASMLVMCGCAGAYAGSGLQVGDVAVATGEVYADLGVLTTDGFHALDNIGVPTNIQLDAGHYDEVFLASCSDGLKAGRTGGMRPPGVFKGAFLTVSTVSGTRARGDELFRRHAALCENMEGAAAAQVAALYGVSFMEVRGISNMVVDRDRGSWDVQTASANCALVVECLIRRVGGGEGD